MKQIYNRPDYNPQQMTKLKLEQRREAENNLSQLSKVGTHNIINYDQVYDPRPTHHLQLPFQPAKDPAEIARAAEVDLVHPGPAATGVPRERVQQMLDPTGASHHMEIDDSNGSSVDMATQRRIDQIVRVEHTNNAIHHVSERN